jgi:hypothetical protein
MHRRIIKLEGFNDEGWKFSAVYIIRAGAVMPWKSRRVIRFRILNSDMARWCQPERGTKTGTILRPRSLLKTAGVNS